MIGPRLTAASGKLAAMRLLLPLLLLLAGAPAERLAWFETVGGSSTLVVDGEPRGALTHRDGFSPRADTDGERVLAAVVPEGVGQPRDARVVLGRPGAWEVLAEDALWPQQPAFEGEVPCWIRRRPSDRDTLDLALICGEEERIAGAFTWLMLVRGGPLAYGIDLDGRSWVARPPHTERIELGRGMARELQSIAGHLVYQWQDGTVHALELATGVDAVIGHARWLEQGVRVSGSPGKWVVHVGGRDDGVPTALTPQGIVRRHDTGAGPSWRLQGRELARGGFSYVGTLR